MRHFLAYNFFCNNFSVSFLLYEHKYVRKYVLHVMPTHLPFLICVKMRTQKQTIVESLVSSFHDMLRFNNRSINQHKSNKRENNESPRRMPKVWSFAVDVMPDTYSWRHKGHVELTVQGNHANLGFLNAFTKSKKILRCIFSFFLFIPFFLPTWTLLMRFEPKRIV